ncbi:MAG: orotidine-5-phosphate decarboxylase [Gaiellales bacterium]|nr:orotidine-5-phosphate decarboxylase [Gaiellales bacterium]
MASSFRERLERLAAERRSVLCVGLDPRPELLPREVFRGVRDGPAGEARALERFCAGIVEAVAEHAVAVKPQLAFFEAAGRHGLGVLERISELARERGLLVIADGKRGDIGSTAEAYAKAYLAARRDSAPLADALTVNPYLGADSLQPFADACAASGGLMFVLVRTSNPGGGDLQDLELADGSRVWEHAARLVASFAPVAGAVVGATHPGAVARARELMPDATFLLPGIGAQGGEIASLGAAFAPGPAGGLVSASRSVLYAARADGVWQSAAAAEAARLRAATWALVEEHE